MKPPLLVGLFSRLRRYRMARGRRTPQDIDAMYAVNVHTYERDFLPVYRGHFIPKYLVQFPIILPFHVPLEDGTCMTLLSADPEHACTYHFSTVVTKRTVSMGIAADVTEIPVSASRVEMTYATTTNLTTDGKSDPTEKFDELLDGLNLIISAYMIQTKDTDVYRVSKEMLELASMYRIIPVLKWGSYFQGIFMLHFNMPYRKKALSKEEADRLVWVAAVLRDQRNPFMLSEELALSARRFSKNGFYGEAVLYAQMNVEMFLSTLLTQLLLYEGKSSEEIESILEDTAFMSMVKKEFHPRLGGYWNPDADATKIGMWYRHAYNVRNKIVHAGYKPSADESFRAVAEAEHFRSYVLELIKSKAAAYPELQDYFIIS